MLTTDEERAFYFRYWCCLNLGTKVMLEICVLQFRTMLGYIPKDIFDQAWTTTGQEVDDFWYKIFIVLYPLHLVQLTIPDVGDVDVYQFVGFWWFDFSAFADQPEYLCPERCRILYYPN